MQTRNGDDRNEYLHTHRDQWALMWTETLRIRFEENAAQIFAMNLFALKLDDILYVRVCFIFGNKFLFNRAL